MVSVPTSYECGILYAVFGLELCLIHIAYEDCLLSTLPSSGHGVAEPELAQSGAGATYRAEPVKKFWVLSGSSFLQP